MTEMPTEQHHQAPDERDWQASRNNRWLYVTIVAVFAVLLVVALLSYHTEKATAEAQQKAEQLITRLQAAGFNIPDTERARDVVVSLFGTDGGRLCEDPGSSFMRALLASRLATGGGVASRPVIFDRRMFVAEEIALSVYCPSKLPGFREFVADLKTADTLPR